MQKTIRPEMISENTFKMIGKDWLLVTAQADSKANTMTASWGGMGILWNKAVATIYLRPSRYTKELIDKSETFSLSVMPQKYKTALDYCGSHSGRNEDKLKQAKLELEYMNGTPWIKNARLAFICRKLYVQEFDPNSFVDEKILNQNYKKDDFHTMYIGEILKIIENER